MTRSEHADSKLLRGLPVVRSKSSMGPINVALDFRRVRRDGIGRITLLIAEALLADERVDLTLLGPATNTEPLGRPDVRRLDFNWPVISADAMDRLPGLLRRCRADVFIGPQWYTPYRLACPTVVFLHDAYALEKGSQRASMADFVASFGRQHVDWFMNEISGYLSTRNGMDQASTLDLYKGAYRAVADRAGQVVTVSHFGRDHLLAHLPQLTSKILVAQPFTPDRLLRTRLPRTRAHLLHVGKWEPRKRQHLLLEAMALATRHQPDLRLAMVGGPYELHQRYASTVQDLLERRRTELSISWEPQVSELELAARYRSAVATINCSSFEGFGLPVLEAMSLGSPVLTTGAGALPEVCGDADLRVADTPEAIAAGVLRLWREEDLSRSYEDAALRRGATFTRAGFADRVVKALRKAVGRP